MEHLGKKILVLGVSASGESTFARTLAEKTRLPLVHIDAFMWMPGWQYIGDEKTVAKLHEIGAGEEGYFFIPQIDNVSQKGYL